MHIVGLIGVGIWTIVLMFIGYVFGAVMESEGLNDWLWKR